jgi:hypothetical protein
MRVRALSTGYYDHKRRRQGDVFDLIPIEGHKLEITRNAEGRRVSEKLVKHKFTPQEQFSEKWIEKVDKQTPLKVSTAQKALNAVQQDLKSGRVGPSDASDESVI